MIYHSHVNKRTVHITLFDPAGAFGSISHDPIHESLQKFRVPKNTVTYVDGLYSRLQGVVAGPNWSSEIFSFKKGVLRGDPSSPIILFASFIPV